VTVEHIFLAAKPGGALIEVPRIPFSPAQGSRAIAIVQRFLDTLVWGDRVRSSSMSKDHFDYLFLAG
jgi:hypothetical protein